MQGSHSHESGLLVASRLLTETLVLAALLFGDNCFLKIAAWMLAAITRALEERSPGEP